MELPVVSWNWEKKSKIWSTFRIKCWSLLRPCRTRREIKKGKLAQGLKYTHEWSFSNPIQWNCNYFSFFQIKRNTFWNTDIKCLIPMSNNQAYNRPDQMSEDKKLTINKLARWFIYSRWKLEDIVKVLDLRVAWIQFDLLHNIVPVSTIGNYSWAHSQ